MEGDDLVGGARGQLDAAPALLRAERRVGEEELAELESAAFGLKLEQRLRQQKVCGIGRTGLKKLMEVDTEGFERAVLCKQPMNCVAA
jgi:hypothetical protein